MSKSVKNVAAGMAKGGFEAAGVETLALARGIARTTWLVGLGAVATVGEAGVATFDRMVAKGRRRRESPAEKLERKVAEARHEAAMAVKGASHEAAKVIESTGREAAKLVESTGRAVYKQVSSFLSELGVPNQSDIRALRARIEALRERLS